MKFVLASMIGLLVAGNLEDINKSSGLMGLEDDVVDSVGGEEYLPRRRSKDTKAAKTGRRRLQTKAPKDAKTAKDSKTRRRLQSKASKDSKDGRRRWSKDPKDAKFYDGDDRRRQSKDAKDAKLNGRRRFDSKDPKDSKEGGRRRQAKDTKAPKTTKAPKLAKTNDETTTPEGEPTSPETPTPAPETPDATRRIDVDDWTTAVESNVKNFFGF